MRRYLNDEAKAAIRRKVVPNGALLRMLISNEECEMPSSQQVRQMAAEILLVVRGFDDCGRGGMEMIANDDGVIG